MLRDTLARADACGLHVAPLDTLPRLQDVDTMQVRGGGRSGVTQRGLGVVPLSKIALLYGASGSIH